MMINEHGSCPNCGVDLNGGSIWEHFFEKCGNEAEATKTAAMYGATREQGWWSRQIGIADMRADRVVRWKCPDCGQESKNIMNVLYQNRQQNNKQALEEPIVGDFWHERFCPYFLVVDIQDDAYTVLCVIEDPDTQNAKINGVDSWEFDYSKHSVVTKDWIQKTVRYRGYDGFVADVIRSEKYMIIVNEWCEANPDYVPIIKKSINQDIWFRGV